MEKQMVNIFYFTDNKSGKEVSSSIEYMGMPVTLFEGINLSSAKISETVPCIVIIDVEGKKLPEILTIINNDKRIEKSQKVVIIEKNDLMKGLEQSNKILNIEFIERPVNKREFVIYIEKSAAVEKYRDMLRECSTAAKGHIETYEALLLAYKQDVFENESEKKAFEKIIQLEKNLVDQQNKLNQAIKEFTFNKQSHMLELKKYLEAEAMLDTLRQKELIQANDTIKAQESVISFSVANEIKNAADTILAQQAVMDFSNKIIDEKSKILQAHEITVELSREEALNLHNEIKKLQDENQKLKDELAKLKGK
jgi:hypothetical protein